MSPAGAFDLQPVGSAGERAEWESYLRSRPASVYSETMAWRDTLADAFGLPDRFLLARRETTVVGALGLVENAGLLAGPHAISGPLSCSGGGLHYDAPEVLQALLAEAERRARERRLGYVLVQSVDRFAAPGWTVDERYATFVLPLGGDPDAAWRRGLTSGARQQVRRAQRQPFELRHGHDQLEVFLDVIHRGVKELGSPTPGRPLFAAAARRFGEDVDFAVLYLAGRPVAGSVMFFHRDTVSVPWIRALREHNRFAANSLLYWEVIRLACARGCQWLDLGRSRVGSTNDAFKRHFGARSRPLYYHYLLHRARRPPDLDPRSLRFRIAAAGWRHLPDPVTRALGPRLMRELI